MPGLHVEEVVVETLVSGGVWFPTLPAIKKEAQRREGSFDCFVACDKSTLYANWISGKGKTSWSDTARRSLAGAVRHQAILWICLFQEIVEGKTLERLELLVGIGGWSRLHASLATLSLCQNQLSIGSE